MNTNMNVNMNANMHIACDTDVLIGHVHMRSIDGMRYNLMKTSEQNSTSEQDSTKIKTYYVYKNNKYNISIPTKYLFMEHKISITLNNKLNYVDYVDYKNDIRNCIKLYGYYPKTFEIRANDEIEYHDDSKIQIPKNIIDENC